MCWAVSGERRMGIAAVGPCRRLGAIPHPIASQCPPPASDPGRLRVPRPRLHAWAPVSAVAHCRLRQSSAASRQAECSSSSDLPMPHELVAIPDQDSRLHSVGQRTFRDLPRDCGAMKMAMVLQNSGLSRRVACRRLLRVVVLREHWLCGEGEPHGFAFAVGIDTSRACQPLSSMGQRTQGWSRPAA